jgi:nitrogen fixation NifU-like protein
MYSNKTMEHFNDPHHVGKMVDADAIGTAGNPHDGDTVYIYIKVQDNYIIDISFQTFGCAAAIATSSMLTDLAINRSLEEAEQISRQDVADALDGLPERKMDCSNIAPDALKQAIQNYREKG